MPSTFVAAKALEVEKIMSTPEFGSTALELPSLAECMQVTTLLSIFFAAEASPQVKTLPSTFVAAEALEVEKIMSTPERGSTAVESPPPAGVPQVTSLPSIFFAAKA